MTGKLIVVEGLDRAGKSTQCALLAERLRQHGQDVVELKFPDRGTGIGKLINTFLTEKTHEITDEAIHLMFSANRWELVPKIRKLLTEGKTLIVDRYSYSGIAFTAAKGLDFEWCAAPDHGLPEPDRVIFLDVDEKLAAQRGGYGNERYETKDMQQRARSQFTKLREPGWAWILAEGSIEEVAEEIYRAVRPLFM